jgi:hypothetical protein
VIKFAPQRKWRIAAYQPCTGLLALRFAAICLCSGFLGCGSDVSFGVAEASEFGAVVVVVVEVEFLPWESWLAASYAWCAVGAGE